ncbi:MAG TPA: L,D-transpeptidase family protein [Xanthobacteraceae bacterium]|nr:L,D-transpeptidase family protein [Xanthobacteraceae bacterium]
MRRLYPFPLAVAVILGLATPAAAQFGPPIMPSDGFRKSPPPQQLSPAPAPARPALAPAVGAGTTGTSAPLTPRLAVVWDSPEPTFDEGTIDRIAAALKVYTALETLGGWPALPASAAKLVPGGAGPDVGLLRRRLAITNDIAPAAASGEIYDETLVAAVKRFQMRHGLTPTGAIGPQTLTALNVPVEKRVRQLAASYERLSETSFKFGQRYVVVNIPAAVAEAVAGGRVEHRYVAVVGKPDRPSPTVTTLITSVNLNPTWTAPLSIAKKDIVPKMAKDPTYLSRMHMRLLDAQGGEIDPALIDWTSGLAPAYTVRQDPGAWNSLGYLRIDMPNPHSVYMHDTPHRELFGSDYRFHSSGCARIGDVRALAAWLLQDNAGWGRKEIDAGIAAGQRTDIKLARSVPVAWIYLTGWAMRDGTVHFRNDIYNHDEVPARRFMVSVERPVATAAMTRGFSLQSAEPERFEQVSYLDSR